MIQPSRRWAAWWLRKRLEPPAQTGQLDAHGRRRLIPKEAPRFALQRIHQEVGDFLLALAAGDSRLLAQTLQDRVRQSSELQRVHLGSDLLHPLELLDAHQPEAVRTLKVVAEGGHRQGVELDGRRRWLGNAKRRRTGGNRRADPSRRLERFMFVAQTQHPRGQRAVFCGQHETARREGLAFGSAAPGDEQDVLPLMEQRFEQVCVARVAPLVAQHAETQSQLIGKERIGVDGARDETIVDPGHDEGRRGIERELQPSQQFDLLGTGFVRQRLLRRDREGQPDGRHRIQRGLQRLGRLPPAAQGVAQRGGSRQQPRGAERRQ